MGVRRLAFFFFALAIMAVCLNAAFTRGFRNIKTSEFGISNRVMSGTINAQIVISGSSRAFVHYDPRIIQSITGETAFNLGQNGVQTDLQLAFLKTYLRHNTRPDLIIHNLDPQSLTLAR